MKTLVSLMFIAGMFASCSNMNKNEGGNMASNDMAAKQEARVQEFYEKVLNAHNADIVDQYCTADFVNHQPDMNHSGKGIDDLKASFKEWFAMMPDLKCTAEMVASKGDNVMVKFTMTGTNTGPMGKMPATGKSMNIEGMEMIAFNKDGKATDRWGFAEEMKMMKQLGMMGDMNMDQKMAEEGKMMDSKKK